MMLYRRLERRDCSLNAPGFDPAAFAATAEAATQRLHLDDWPITTVPQRTTERYLDYLRLPQGRIDLRRTGVLVARDARLSYPTGVQVSRAGIVLDAYPNHSVLQNPKYAAAQLALPCRPPASRQGEGFLLYTSWGHNFYHWTIDMLPRLGFLDETAGPPLVVYKGAPGFVRQSLDHIAPHREILWLDTGVHAFDRLHVPSNLASPAVVSETALDFLRNRYLPRLRAGLEAPSPDGQRLYISRRDAGSRRIANEAELEDMLAGFGFLPVVMSENSLARQAELFARASFIVGSHGAAFANLAFCTAGTPVIEIFRDGHQSRSFYSMAGLLGLPYGFMTGSPAGTDIAVDTALLRNLLSKMGA